MVYFVPDSILVYKHVSATNSKYAKYEIVDG